MTYTTASTRWLYNALFAVPIYMLRHKNINAQDDRHFPELADVAPTFLLRYNGLVLMRGEERSADVPIEAVLAALRSKMPTWNPRFYGDLPHIIGYAASGPHLVVVAIEKAGDSIRTTELLNISVLEQRADSVKFAFNLASLLHKMAESANHSPDTGLIPFRLDENDKRSIAMLDDRVVRIIKRSSSVDQSEFERLHSVYTTLQSVSTTNSSATTHLPKVDKLSVNADGRLVVELSPIGIVRRPKIREVEKWLRDMLMALQHWHGRGYCHGDICWSNMMFVKTGDEAGNWVLLDMDKSFQPDLTNAGLAFRLDLMQLGNLMEALKLPKDLATVRSLLLSAVETLACTATKALTNLEMLVENSRQ